MTGGAPERIEEWVKGYEEYARDTAGRGRSAMFTTYLHGGMYVEQTLLSCPGDTAGRCPKPPA